jgi:hypothetical protein
MQYREANTCDRDLLLVLVKRVPCDRIDEEFADVNQITLQQLKLRIALRHHLAVLSLLLSL